MIDTLGDDADLLARSDQWLEEERRTIAQEMDNLANQLRATMSAIKIKRKLQQRNLVAVQHLCHNNDGDIVDIIIRLMPLPDALQLISNPRNELDVLNRETQLRSWADEGFDLAASAALRAG